RVEGEAAALGRLEHEGIARIYEAGWFAPGGELTSLGRLPFFAMEYVEGVGLTEIVRGGGARADAGGGTPDTGAPDAGATDPNIPDPVSPDSNAPASEVHRVHGVHGVHPGSGDAAREAPRTRAKLDGNPAGNENN